MRRLACIALLALACSAAAGTVPLLRDYRHTSWTTNDGAPAQISALAQSPDGWLWLGTEDGLYRFDGLTFEHIAVPDTGMLSRSLILSLLAADNGDLWIGHKFDGLSVRHPDGRVDDIPSPAGKPLGAITAMAFDRSGILWVLGADGLYQLRRTGPAWVWHKVLDSAAWRKPDTYSLLRDQDGGLWGSWDGRVFRQDRASGQFVPVGPAGAHGSVTQSPDGRIWARLDGGLAQVGPATGKRLSVSNQRGASWDGQFDRDGNLWEIRGRHGVCVLPASATAGTTLDPGHAGECLVDAGQISSPDAGQLLEDREGNVWIATESGLDRYQPNRLRQSGLAGAGTPISIAAGADGGVWAADVTDGTLWRLAAGSAPERQPGYVRVVGTARDGALLLAGKRTIERRLHGVVTQIPLPPGRDGVPVDLHVLGTLDDGKVLWMSSFETGLMGLVDGAWQPRSAFNLPPKIVITAAGAPGQLWIADGDGGVSLYDNGKLTRHDATVAGIATAVFAGPEVMVAGERGLAVLQNGAIHLLKADQPDVLRKISGMAITPDGDRWFNGLHGVVHVQAADWRAALAQPGALLRYTLLDARDGYPGQASTVKRLPGVVQAGGGQLWFLASGGVVRLETRTLRRNLVAPAVRILHAGTAGATYAASEADVRLPPGAPDFSIAFTAPALRRPENVRYAWWLEGVDRGWVDGGTRRAASYTNVAPGRYRFHVRATNEDGVAGAAEAVQAIVIPPTLVQTAWFKALCALLLALAGVAVYRYRIRVLTARLLERMQVRASERERIARTLHDTYLQSVQALLLRVSALTHTLPAGSPMRARLDTILRDATHAIVEGRTQVEKLRAGSPAAFALALEDTIENVLARSAGPLRQCYPDVAYDMQVTGTRRGLAPDVLDEAGQVAAEALRNAFIHAMAGTITVVVDYGAAFSVQVRDDGKGLDDDVRAAGYRSGHWGLLGMRERAGNVGAQLVVDSAPGAGTTVRLTVPGARAYPPAERQASLLARWLGARA